MKILYVNGSSVEMIGVQSWYIRNGVLCIKQQRASTAIPLTAIKEVWP